MATLQIDESFVSGRSGSLQAGLAASMAYKSQIRRQDSELKSPTSCFTLQPCLHSRHTAVGFEDPLAEAV